MKTQCKHNWTKIDRLVDLMKPGNRKHGMYAVDKFVGYAQVEVCHYCAASKTAIFKKSKS